MEQTGAQDDGSGDLTLAQLIEHVEALEENMRLKKEAVFQRVLDSLGGPLPPDQAILSSEAIQILNDSRQKRELRKLEEQQRLEDEKERIRFEEERNRLRRRFDKDSVDAIGDDPLALRETIEPADITVSTLSDPVALETALGSGMDDDAFDVILSELESELSAQAMDKNEELSELAEVLKILDHAASKRPAVPAQIPLPPVAPASSAAPPLPEAQTASPMPPLPPSLPSSQPAINVKTHRVPTQSVGAAQSQSRRMAPAEMGDERRGEDDDLDSDEDDRMDWKTRRHAHKLTHHSAEVLPTISGPVANSSGLVTAERRTTDARSSPGHKISVTVADNSCTEEDEDVEEEEEEEEEQRVSPIDREPCMPPTRRGDSSTEPPRPSAVSITPAHSSSCESATDEPSPRPGDGERSFDLPAATIPEQEAGPPAVSAICPSPPPAESLSVVSGSLLGVSAASTSGSSRKGKRAIMSQARITRPLLAAEHPPLPPSSPPAVAVEPPSTAPEEATETRIAAQPPQTCPHAPAVEVQAPIEAAEDVIAVDLCAALQAPALHPFPAAVFADKRTGTRWEPQSGLQAETSQLIDLKRIVAVTVNCKLLEDCSDVYLVRFLHHIVANTASALQLLSVVWDRPAHLLHVVLTAVAATEGDEEEEVFTGTVRPLVDQTRLVHLVPDLHIPLDSDGTFGSLSVWRDFQSAPKELLELIQHLCTPLAKRWFVPTLHPLSSGIRNTCVAVTEAGLVLQAEGLDVVAELVQRAEIQGLRLVGMRAVYCSLPCPTHSRFLNADLHAQSSLALCLAFASCRHGLSPAETLRQIVGPEDPVLAQRTDPDSLRAKFGVSRQHPLVHAMPFFADNLRTQLCVYFGPRESDAHAGELQLLAAPRPSSLQLTVCLSLNVLQIGHDPAARVLAHAQRKLLALLASRVLGVGTHDLRTIGVRTFTSAWASKRTRSWSSARYGRPEGPTEGEESLPSDSSCMLHSTWQLRVTTCAGPQYMEQLRDDLWKLFHELEAAELVNLWAVLAHSPLSSQATHKNMENNGLGRLAATQACKTVDLADYASHYHLGLCDVCMVTVASKESNPTSGPPAEGLSKLLAALPVHTAAHMLAITTLSSGANSSITAILRGWQLLECIEDAVDLVKESVAGALEFSFVKGKRVVEELCRLWAGDLDAVSLVLPAQSFRETYPRGAPLVSQLGSLLFPPQDYSSWHVVLVPWTHTGVTQTRRLGRVIKALAKCHYSLLRAVLKKPGALWLKCVKETAQLHEYLPEIVATAEASAPSICCILLLRGNGVGDLRRCMGPLLDGRLAVESYPTSLASTLAHSSTGSASSMESSPTPAALVGSHVSNIDAIVRECFADCLPAWQKLRGLASSDDPGSSSYQDTVPAFSVDTKRRAVLRPTASRTVVPPDLACVVLSSELWFCDDCHEGGDALDATLGLAELLDVLAREGIAVVNMATAELNSATAKTLWSCAGQSSLTLRPADPSALTRGPALLLGLCAPAHALEKMKLLSTRGATLVAGSSRTVWQSGNGEVAALVSSSARLARELFCLCFDRAHGSDCAYFIESS